MAATDEAQGRIALTVDTGRCIGAGQCTAIAPDYFDQDEDDGTSIVLQQPEDDDARAIVAKAEARCPAQAILLRR